MKEFGSEFDACWQAEVDEAQDFLDAAEEQQADAERLIKSGWRRSAAPGAVGTLPSLSSGAATAFAKGARWEIRSARGTHRTADADHILRCRHLHPWLASRAMFCFPKPWFS